MGPIACLTGLHNGEIRTDPNLIAILDRLSAEGVALARAHGCDPPAKIVIPAAGPIAGHKQSMPQDLERGRPVEYQPIASPLPRLRICCCASLHWGGSVRRRNFIAIAGGAAAWPFMVRAQPSNVPVIGYLGSESPQLFASRLRAFLEGLRTTGYDEGRNVAIEYRWAEGHNDRLPALAHDLVRRGVSVIAAPGSLAAALAAKAASTTIPVVFETGADPVAAGLVASLDQPGGNLTGVTSLNAQVGPKRLQLLHELMPTAAAIALLVNPTNPRNAEANQGPAGGRRLAWA